MRARGGRLAALLALGVVALVPSLARAERRLTLAEAVQIALGFDPGIREGNIASERAKLAVLRAQLDRISLTVDGSLQELWNKSNLGGAAQSVTACMLPNGEVQPGLAGSLCTMLGGTVTTTAINTEGGQGLTNLSARLTVPIFSGFRVSSNVALRQRQEDAANEGLRQARKDTAIAIARAYWAVRRLDLARGVIAGAVERLKESEAVTDVRLRAGLAPPIDRNRALSQRLQQESTVADLAGQAREQAAQLAALLGIDDDLVLVDEPAAAGAPPPTLDELLSKATKTRPELARAELLYRAQEQVVRIVRADYYPQLSGFGLFQYGNNQFNAGSGARTYTTDPNPFNSMTGSVTVGLQLNMNFFNMLNTWTSDRDARYELARLGEERRVARRQVEVDVRLARARLEHLAAQRAPLVAARDVAADNVKIIEGRYENGEALVIEVIQAQIDLTTVERQLADLSAQIQLGWLELDAALGNTVGLNR